MSSATESGAAKDPEMSDWLQKWTNYLKGYQKRWFVLHHGVLSYYRNPQEMTHTCRGSIKLHGALIYTEDTCNLVVSNGGMQTFHLRAASEVERQKWVTALELAKAKAIRTLESEEEGELEEVSAPPDTQEVQNVFRMLSAKLEDMQTCCDLIAKHGTALQKALGELDSLDQGKSEIFDQKIKQVNERAILFRLTTTAMINASNEYAKAAQDQGKKWQKAIQYEKEQRQRLEKVVEDLAKQHTKLEEAAAASAHGQPVQSDEDDESMFFDAMDQTDCGTGEFTMDLPILSHRRTSSGVSVDSRKSEGGKSDSSNENEVKDSHGSSQAVTVCRSKEEKSSRSIPKDENCGKTISRKQRRKRVPDKPDYPLSLWNIVKNCIGKDLTKIPMPVNFSEPLSMLQRLTEDFEYSEILDHAVTCSDSCEQLAYVAAFTVSSYASTSVRTGKPFNPLLGETYECDRMDDLGWRCLSEQVSHHPPMAAQHCEGRGWKSWQEVCLSSKFRGKYLQIIPLGTAHLVFTDTGNHYTWRKVATTVHNIIVGKLWVDNHGEMEIVNHVTGDKCRLKYIPYSYFNRDVQRKVTGCVVDKEERVSWVLNGTWDGKMEACKVLKQKNSEKGSRPVLELDNAILIWTRRMPPPDSEKYYNFTELACQLNEPESDVAPTDSRNRPDQRLMEDGRWEEANGEKIRLEEKQRAVRRQREADAERAAAEGNPFPPYEPIWFYKEKDPQTGNVMHLVKEEYWKCKETGDWSRCPDIF